MTDKKIVVVCPLIFINESAPHLRMDIDRPTRANNTQERGLIMPRKEFKGDTIEEVRQAVERWTRDHPEIVVTKQYAPVEILFGGAHFLSKNEGPGIPIGAVIVIDYADAAPGPAHSASDQAQS
jgi:hypothetical protein